MVAHADHDIVGDRDRISWLDLQHRTEYSLTQILGITGSAGNTEQEL